MKSEEIQEKLTKKKGNDPSLVLFAFPHQTGSFNIERLREFVGLRMHLQILGDLIGDFLKRGDLLEGDPTFPGISKDSYGFSVQFSGWIVSAIQTCPKRKVMEKVSKSLKPRPLVTLSVNENMLLSNSASGSMHFYFPACHRFPKDKTP